MAGIDLDKIRKEPAAGAKPKDGESPLMSFLSKDIKLFGNTLSDKKKERFYSELHVLISSKIDVKTVLEIIEDQQEKKSDKELFSRIRERVIGGMSLSQSLEKENMFSPYEVFSLRIGEESGKMAEILFEQANYFSKKIKQKRQMVQAFSYPLVVMTVTFGIMYFMLRFIVPMFQNMFRQFGADLPMITKVVLRASHFISSYGFFIILAVAATIIFFYTRRKKEWFRWGTSAFLLKIPFMSNMIKKVYLARFCQSMSLLLSSRTRLISAIELVEQMVGFYPIEQSLGQIKTDIEKGEPLHKSMSRFKIYPRQLTSVIKVAEEVNQLDAMFGRMAKQYSDDVEYETSIMNTVLEPLLIIFIGAFICILMLSIYLPMLQMGGIIH